MLDIKTQGQLKEAKKRLLASLRAVNKLIDSPRLIDDAINDELVRASYYANSAHTWIGNAALTHDTEGK